MTNIGHYRPRHTLPTSPQIFSEIICVTVGPCLVTSEQDFVLSQVSGTLSCHKRAGPCLVTSEQDLVLSQASGTLSCHKWARPCLVTSEWDLVLSQALNVLFSTTGILVAAYSPLGSPDRPYSNKEAQPVVLNDPVLNKIAEKHKCSAALVSNNEW